MCDTPTHGSDHLWLIWKESIQNCRCYRADTAGGTDGRTDGRTEWNQYTPQQLRCSGGIINLLGQSRPTWQTFWSVSVQTIAWYLFNRHSITRTNVELLSIGTYGTLLHFVYICDVKLGFYTQFLLLQQNIETDLIYFCNTLRPRQNGRHFPDHIFKCIFLNENVSVAIKIILGFVATGPINNIPALFQIMAWRHPSNKPLSETMMVRLPTNKFQWNLNRNSKHFHWRKDIQNIVCGVLLVSSQP